MRVESDRWTSGRRGQAGAWLAAAVAMTLLAGCTVFADAEPEPATIQADTDESQFPNVGDVPDAAPETTTAEERQVIVEELQADQASAGVVITETSETTETSEVEIVEPATTELVAVAEPVMVEETVVTTNSATAVVSTQGYAYTSIQTPPATESYSTGTRNATVPAATTLPLPAAQPLPSVVPSYGTETTAGGQVTVDYSAIGGGTNDATYAQTAYNGYGATGEPVALIYFQNGSASLSSHDRSVIRDVAELQKARGGLIQIVGHASMRTGTVDPATHDEANFDISLARANAVADALLREGVNPANVQAAAAGSTAPEYYEFTPTGEAANRRAEIYLVY